MLLAIDASSTATGYAFGGPKNGAPRGGVWKLPGADEHVLDMTLGRASESIIQLCGLIKAEHVAIETPLMVMGNNASAHTLMALMQLTGAIRAAAHRAGCSVQMCAISSVRKHFIGRGNMKSAEAKAAVQDRCRLLNWDYGDSNDRSDANAVWAYAMSRRYPEWAPKATPLFRASA